MPALLKNYQKIAWRNLTRHPALSLLNFTGLLIGTVASLLIFGYAAYESSYDTFQRGDAQRGAPAGNRAQPNHQRIYRVASKHYQEGVLQRATAFTVPALGPTVAEQIPGIADYFRITSWAPSYTLTYTGKNTDPVIFKEKQAYFADAKIIRYLGLQFLQGDPEQALTGPSEMILSVSTAHRYFGSEWENQEVVGQILEYHDAYQGNLMFTVAGIFEDYPANSHLQFDLLFSHASLPRLLPEEIPPKQRAEMFDVSWGPPTWYTYLVLEEHSVVDHIEKHITALAAEYNADPDHREELSLQPIQSIHLHSDLQDEPRAHGSASQVFILSVIGIMTLMIAWINYVNLVIVKSLSRAKEVALRKIFSASRRQLLKQFMLEALLSNTVVLLFAAALLWLLYPQFTDYLQLPDQPAFTNQPTLWVLLLTLLVSGTLATGLYPAWLLSSFPPLITLKNRLSPSNDSLFRHILVIFQLGGALLLIVMTFAAARQLQYMQEKGAGVEIRQTLVIEAPNVLNSEAAFSQQVEALRTALQPLVSVQQVAATNFIPGSSQLWNIQAARLTTPDNVFDFKQINVDQQYLHTIDALFLAGVNFNERSDPEGKIILNRAATQLLGFQNPEDAINQILKIFHGGWTPELEIVGVIENYHQRSLENAYEPILFFPNPDNGNVLVKLSATTEDLAQVVESVRKAWNKTFPGNPFDYFFLQDFYQQQYQSEARFSKASRLGTVVAVLVALLGLIALISFTTLKKRKEIGIRKVMGASVENILLLLTRRLIVLVGIACALALPIAYVLVERWMENYAFRVGLSGWLFIIPTLMMIVLVILTLSYHTWKAAHTSPTKVLRYE